MVLLVEAQLDDWNPYNFIYELTDALLIFAAEGQLAGGLLREDQSEAVLGQLLLS